MDYLSLTAYELANYYHYCYLDICEEELYKCVYRLTEGFTSSGILKAELDEVNAPIDFGKERIYQLLESGDNGSYKTETMRVTTKDFNDIRLMLDFSKGIKEKKYKEDLDISNEKRISLAYETIKPIYEKYKDFRFDVEALEFAINYFTNGGNRLKILDELFSYWDNEAEPFLRLVSYQEEYKTFIPEELNNDKGLEFLGKTILIGLMNSDYSWADETTNYQKAYWIELASEKLKIRKKWKWAEKHWNLKCLAQTRRESRERFGMVPREKEIERIFE